MAWTVCEIFFLQALKAVSHNYPHIMFAFWEQVSSVVSNFLHEAAPEVSTGQWRVQSRNSVGIIGEKVITAAVKVTFFSPGSSNSKLVVFLECF